MALMDFSCLIALVHASSTIINSSGDSKHPCLVPDLSGNVSSLLIPHLVDAGFRTKVYIFYDVKEVAIFYFHK